MSKPEIITPEQNNEELFTDSQRMIQAKLVEIAGEVIGIEDANVTIKINKKSGLVSIDETAVTIAHKRTDAEQTEVSFSYYRPGGHNMLPSVRLKRTWVDEAGFNIIEDHLRRDEETGSMVRERKGSNNHQPGMPPNIRPARPATILTMARIAAFHAKSAQS
jgi:hypothetical protein